MDTKILRKREQAGSRGECLKKGGGGWNPLTNYGWFNIVNPFYFNLSEVVFHLEKEGKLNAINCVVVLSKMFISSVNSE